MATVPDDNKSPTPGQQSNTTTLFEDLRRLGLSPRAFFADAANSPDNRPYVIAVYGYFFMALTQGMQGISGDTVNEDVYPLVGVTIAMAAILGIPVAAFIFGGLLHGFSAVLGSKRRMQDTIALVGFAFFWPGLFSAIASLAHVILAGEINLTLVITVWYVAGAWALFTSTAAIKVLNDFTWLRAALTWCFYLVLLAAFWWLMQFFAGLGF